MWPSPEESHVEQPYEAVTPRRRTAVVTYPQIQTRSIAATQSFSRLRVVRVKEMRDCIAVIAVCDTFISISLPNLNVRGIYEAQKHAHLGFW